MRPTGNRIAGVNARTRQLLSKAFHQAEKAEWLWTAPNPRVGALALAGGHIIGYGCHEKFGGPHAEEQALRDAGAWDPNTDKAIAGIVDQMVVTLEPCSSTCGKKRPPCSQALLDAGVKNLLVGALDPDPRHAGRGLEILRQAGLQVELAEPSGQIRFEQQNPAFLAQLQRPQRPWVLFKWAASLDGKTATNDGVSHWISGEESRREVHDLRALSDAVLCGKGTLLADDPQLSARRSPIPYARQPLRVLLGGADLVDAKARIFANSGPRLWAWPSDQTIPDWLQKTNPEDALLLIGCQAQKFDLNELLERLTQDFQVRRLLVEGGAHLHGAMLRLGLVDALVRYEAPLLLGGNFGSCLGESFADPQHAVRLMHEERADLGHDLRRAFLLQFADPDPKQFCQPSK
jgi:diaminohydroxyphosphoribosylaminopyrimidine deaminase / 5-amino-6-(5-phosphoribosylamino)uracil reductase